VDVENGCNVKRAVKIYHGSEDVFLTYVIADIVAQLGEAFELQKKKTSSLQKKLLNIHSKFTRETVLIDFEAHQRYF
jgi:hypothetical protein